MPAVVLAATDQPVQKPNILLVVADDLGYGDLQSFYAQARVETPNISALAARGMRFSRFYTDSTCSASRAALLTGRHPASLGFHPVARGIAPDVTTLPEWLREQGYGTHHIGKWHLGEWDGAALPAAQGFDTSFGFLNQWLLQGPDSSGQAVMRPPVYSDPWLRDETDQWRQHAGYLPDILTGRAVRQIEQLADAGKPWFLYYATPLVHGPLHNPPGAAAGDAAAQHAAMLRHLDENIGSLVQALERSGQRDNTVLIFLSDNGAPDKRPGSNAPFDGGKGHYTEGGVRVPMIWVDSSAVQAGSLDERAVTLMDILPTLAGRLGVPAPAGVDGVDVHSLSSYGPLPKRPLYWLSRDSYSAIGADKRSRLGESWVFREIQQQSWVRVLFDGVQDSFLWYGLRSYDRLQLKRDFRRWLETVSRTVATTEALPGGGYRLSGNDFLRAPLREWDFYLALGPSPAREEQWLAGQDGIWSVHYRPASSTLRVQMHGLDWQVPLPWPAGDCVLLGLNADIYDRHTNVDGSRYPSELRLSVNGREVARTEWQVGSVGGLPIAQPTQVGAAMTGSGWQGKVLAPVLFHRASVVGDWPFLIDEKALQQQLCATVSAP